LLSGALVFPRSAVNSHTLRKALDKVRSHAERTATGKDALVRSDITGKGAMPPKAGKATCPEADIKAAVDYMLASVK